MTVNVARRTRRGDAAPGGADHAGSLAIGEIDQTVFDCPRCARPLALGTGRCPGCRTRLVNRIPATTAAAIASVGLVFGVLVGAGGGYLFARQAAGATGPAGSAVAATAGDPASSAQPAPTAATPSPTPAPTATAATDPGIPPATRAALTQAVATNARLAAGAAALETALRARVFDAPAVVRTLRAMSADSVYGEQLAARLASWSGSADAADDLSSLYETVHETAVEALDASVRNGAAYRAAARAMLDDLAGLPATDAALREIAAANGVSLAAVPGASGAPGAPDASAPPAP